MIRRGHAGRTDANHTEVIDALRAASMKAYSLATVGGGVPDVVVGFRGLTMLLEIKDGAKTPSARKLTADEQNWHDTWPGHVAIVESAEGAVLAVVEHAKEMGKL